MSVSMVCGDMRLMPPLSALSDLVNLFPGDPAVIFVAGVALAILILLARLMG